MLAPVLALAVVLAIAGAASAVPVAHPRARACRSTQSHHPARRCRKTVKRHHGRATTTSASPAGASAASAGEPDPAPPADLATAAAAAGVTVPTPPAPITVPPPGPSAWDRPALSNPTTIQISDANHVLVLDQSLDYIVQCPPGTLELSSALNIWGGHNVVFENCALDLANPDWAARFSDQSGTLWIHDVHFGGANLTGGIQFQEPGATVVMRDVLFDTVHGSQSTNHAELIQTWAGPARLMIDGLTGSTTYQGLFLEPNQYYSGPAPAVFDLRHIDIDDSQGAYALWLGDVTGSPAGDASGAIPTWNVENLYVVPNPARTWTGWWQWPQPSTGDPTWNGAQAGTPPGGSYVQATTSGATGVDEGTEPPALAGEGA